MSEPREEWQKLGLDPRQWAYDRWWTVSDGSDDPQPLDPQPAPPLTETGSPWWMAMVRLGMD